MHGASRFFSGTRTLSSNASSSGGTLTGFYQAAALIAAEYRLTRDLSSISLDTILEWTDARAQALQLDPARPFDLDFLVDWNPLAHAPGYQLASDDVHFLLHNPAGTFLGREFF